MADKPLISLAQLQSVCLLVSGRRECVKYLAPLNAAMQRYQINTPARISMFLAQIAHESGDFTRVSENLNYSDAKRVVELFRSGFDANRNGIADAAEIETAKRYVRNPIALANRAYANRYGNGNEASGDGWRYRGAGLKQLTFKDNHEAFAKAHGLALATVPEYLRTPEGAALSAAWFWRSHGLNELADAGSFKQITQVINGAQTGAASRVQYLARATQAMAS